MKRLDGRRALITGGAQGLGAASARRMHGEGARVAIADIDLTGAQALADELSGSGGSAIAVELDVTSTGSATGAVARVSEEFEGLDILVNNAGVARDKRLEELTDADWELVLDTSLRGAFVCSRAALPLLRASAAGRIVNMSSRSHLGNPGQANYSAAKAGLIGLTRSLSLELGPDGITVNAVAPGLIDTQLIREHPKSEAIIARALKITPIKRLGLDEDVAAAVAFLASDDASYISGEVLHVTGGRY